MKVIEFYLRKEKQKDLVIINLFLKIFLLKEIDEKFELYLDSENFKKFDLYWFILY